MQSIPVFPDIRETIKKTEKPLKNMRSVSKNAKYLKKWEIYKDKWEVLKLFSEVQTKELDF